MFALYSNPNIGRICIHLLRMPKEGFVVIYYWSFIFSYFVFWLYFFLASKRVPLHCPGSQWERTAVIKYHHRIFIAHFTHKQKENESIPPIVSLPLYSPTSSPLAQSSTSPLPCFIFFFLLFCAQPLLLCLPPPLFWSSAFPQTGKKKKKMIRCSGRGRY